MIKKNASFSFLPEGNSSKRSIYRLADDGNFVKGFPS